jgi:hypothetical protein
MSRDNVIFHQIILYVINILAKDETTNILIGKRWHKNKRIWQENPVDSSPPCDVQPISLLFSSYVSFYIKENIPEKYNRRFQGANPSSKWAQRPVVRRFNVV